MKNPVIAIALALLLVLSVNCGAIGNTETPEQGARAWFDALAAMDGFKVEDRTCKAQQESLRTAGLFATMVQLFGQSQLADKVKIDTTQIDLETVESSGNNAKVRVTGRLRAGIGLAVNSQDLLSVWNMVREDDEWKYCGEASEETAQLKAQATANPRITPPLSPSVQQGRLRVVLQADLPIGETPSTDAMAAAMQIIEKRVKALGVVEPLIQLQGDRRIVVELPGVANPDETIRVLGGTGLLEFVDAGDNPPAEGSEVRTTGPTASDSCSGAIAAAVTPTPGLIATAIVAPTEPITETNPIEPTQVYSTVMTGDCLQTASAVFDPNTNQPEIAFSLKSTGAKILGDYTSSNIGKFLAIVLDKKVISVPRVQSAITTGEGRITGQFTIAEANNLAVQLRFGALPIPLWIESTTIIVP
ncbi:MAG TPA: hypothetical protein VFD70_24890 [Anaerolineae bacterium]|nr:hypothetical protein [Anaerolineae bacterium]